MATFHRVPIDGTDRVMELVKGAPDVILAAAREPLGAVNPSRALAGVTP